MTASSLLRRAAVLGGLLLLLAIVRRPFSDFAVVDGGWTWLPADPDLVDRLLLMIVICVIIWAYVGLLRRSFGAEPGRGVLGVILAASALLSSIPAVFPHAWSADIFSYIAYGRVAAIHGGNPMVDPPSAFELDPAFLSPLAPFYQSRVSVYGPAWNAGSAALTPVAEFLDGDLGTYVALYRLVITGALLACIVCLWVLLGKWAPRFRLWGTLVFAWSPLTLVEASALHNDFVMLAFIGVALLLFQRGWVVMGLAALTVAFLVKWYAIVVLFLVAVGLVSRGRALRQKLLRALLVSGVFLGVAIPWYVAFGSPLESLMAPFGDNLSGVHNSVAEIGAHTATVAGGFVGAEVTFDRASDALRAACQLCVAAVLMWLGLVAWNKRSLASIAGLSCAAFLSMALLAPILWPWYVLPALMLAPFAVAVVRRAVITMSVSVFAIYVLYPSATAPLALTAPRALAVTVPVLAVLVLNRRNRDSLIEPEAQGTAILPGRRLASESPSPVPVASGGSQPALQGRTG